MMKSAIFFVLGFTLVSCSGGHFRSGASSGKGKQQDSNVVVAPVTQTPPPATPPQPEHPSGHQMPPGSAVIPVAVGGASLTCAPDPAIGLSCQSMTPMPYKPNKAFYATAIEKTWIETNFKAKSETSYEVEVPRPILDAKIPTSVMFLDAEQRSISSLDIGVPRALPNLISDGSFEMIHSETVTSQKDAVQIPLSATIWQPRRSQANQACVPLLSLGSSDFQVGFLAAEGKYWVELSSPCSSVSDAPMENLWVAQEVILVPGRVYRLSFAYRNSPNSVTPHKLQVVLDNKSISEIAVVSPYWTYQDFIITAEKESNFLEFREVGTIPGRGTNIDNVHFVELLNTPLADD